MSIGEPVSLREIGSAELGTPLDDGVFQCGTHLLVDRLSDDASADGLRTTSAGKVTITGGVARQLPDPVFAPGLRQQPQAERVVGGTLAHFSAQGLGWGLALGDRDAAVRQPAVFRSASVSGLLVVRSGGQPQLRIELLFLPADPLTEL